MAASKKGISKSPALSVLRMVTKMISVMSQEELEALASGKSRLTITHLLDDGKKKPASQLKTVVADLQKLKDELDKVESTDAGFSILSDAKLSRAELERVARSLELPVLKQDTVRRLEEKIIEALVGSRINSRAVRGK